MDLLGSFSNIAQRLFGLTAPPLHDGHVKVDLSREDFPAREHLAARIDLSNFTGPYMVNGLAGGTMPILCGALTHDLSYKIVYDVDGIKGEAPLTREGYLDLVADLRDQVREKGHVENIPMLRPLLNEQVFNG